MTADPQVIRAERHIKIGALIQENADLVIGRWTQRAVEEQPNAARTHHEALLDDLPHLLNEMARSLIESDNGKCAHCRPAGRHGEQRWEAGWSLDEVVRDYQMLRLVIVEFLEGSLDRLLMPREVMAIGLVLDEAISASVASYVAHQKEAVRRSERERANQEKQAAEAFLRQQTEALQEADQRKDEFLAMLGHELRNPLAPLHNAVQVLEIRGEDASTREWALGVLGRQIRHMTRLVDDLLDIARIGRGKIQLRREKIDLTQVVRSTTEDHRPTLEGAGLALEVELPTNPVWVLGDPTRLSQVLGNLLNNAVKFTNPGGRIQVRLACDPGAQRAHVVVKDTGIGIESEMLPRVFATFTQAERSRDRSKGGLGLGLALVKGLVELHGGEVRAASDGPERGAEFSFWLTLNENN